MWTRLYIMFIYALCVLAIQACGLLGAIVILKQKACFLKHVVGYFSIRLIEKYIVSLQSLSFVGLVVYDC
jgi:hypothetical protein